MEEPRKNEWPDYNANEGVDKATRGDDKSAAPGSVTREFQELGQRLTETARAAWKSEQRQELQQEIADGLRSLRDQLNDTVDTMRTNPRTEKVKEQFTRATDATRVNDIFDELRGGLASGLRTLNSQLERLTEYLETRDEMATRAKADVSAKSDTATTKPAEASDEAAPVAQAEQEASEPMRDLPTRPEGPVERM